MRSLLLGSFISIALLFTSGCDMSQNPISGVTLGANPDGTFEIGLTLKGGGVLVWHNVSLTAKERLLSRYPQVRAITVTTSRDVFDACGNRSRSVEGTSTVLSGSAKDIARAVNSTIKGDIADLESQLKEMKEIRKQTSSTAGMKIRRALTPNGGCHCDAQVAFAPVDNPPPAEVVTIPTAPPLPSVDPGLPPSGEIPPPSTKGTWMDNRQSIVYLEDRVTKLEAKVGSIDTKLDATKTEILAAIAAQKKP